MGERFPSSNSSTNLDINFENFVQIYYEDMEHRLRENTMRTKGNIIDLRIFPTSKNKKIDKSRLRMYEHGRILLKRDVRRPIRKP